MTLYATVTDLWADTPAELQAAATRLNATHQIRGTGTPAERLVDLNDHQRSLADHLGAITITYTQATLLVNARRVHLPFDLTQVRADPRTFADQITFASHHESRSPGVPRRQRLSRQTGYLLPPRTVSVAAPTRWANPFPPTHRSPEAHHDATAQFRAYLDRNPRLADLGAAHLHGLDLACWCPPDVDCHADVWLTTANTTPN